MQNELPGTLESGSLFWQNHFGPGYGYSVHARNRASSWTKLSKLQEVIDTTEHMERLQRLHD